MKNRIATTIVCLTLLALPSCSLLIPNPGNGNVRVPVEEMAQTIQKRVKYIAIFAFSMDAIKRHKAEVCEFADKLSDVLNSYDDKEASFEKLQAEVDRFIDRINNSGVQSAVKTIADMVLTESFNFAWKNYEDLINSDETRVSLIIAESVANGLREACGATLSIMGVDDAPPNIFTLAGK